MEFVLGNIAVVLWSAFGVLFFVLALWLVNAIISLRRIVPINQTHIVQSSIKTVEYGRGRAAGNVYYQWPEWLPKFGVRVACTDESIFAIPLTNYDAYDAKRLPFVVDVVSFFRVVDSSIAAQRLSSPDQLKAQLDAIVRSAARSILGKNHLRSIMEDRSIYGDQFTKEVADQVKEWGVVPVKPIEFTDIRDAKDSKVIHNMMAEEQSSIEMKSRITVAENHRTAQLAEIDAERTVEVQKQDALQQIGIRTAEKDKNVGIANQESQQQIKAAAAITAERDMAVKKVEQVRAAEIAKEVAQLRAEQERAVVVVDADAAKTVAQLEAEANQLTTQIAADANIYAAAKDAEGIRVRGVAAADAEQAMLMAPVNAQIILAQEIGENQGYQEYLLRNRQIEVGEVVGVEMAKAMQNADLKVIANAGDMQSGVSSLGDMFTPKGGTMLSGMMAALANTDEGAALVKRITGSGSTGGTKPE